MVFAADPQITINQPGNIKIGDLGQLISALVGTLLIIAALLAFFFLILGGIQWITSGGDKAGMEAARNKITHAIVGLIIVGAAWAIMILVQQYIPAYYTRLEIAYNFIAIFIIHFPVAIPGVEIFILHEERYLYRVLHIPVCEMKLFLNGAVKL